MSERVWTSEEWDEALAGVDPQPPMARGLIEVTA